MTDERDENGEPLPDEYRLTEFGKKLRSTSLDELKGIIHIRKISDIIGHDIILIHRPAVQSIIRSIRRWCTCIIEAGKPGQRRKT